MFDLLLTNGPEELLSASTFVHQTSKIVYTVDCIISFVQKSLIARRLDTRVLGYFSSNTHQFQNEGVW